MNTALNDVNNISHDPALAMNGWTLFLDPEYEDTAGTIISGTRGTRRVIDAIRVGACDYLTKLCELDVLTISVERALERRMLLRNARRNKRDLEHRNAELAGQKTEMERLQAQ